MKEIIRTGGRLFLICAVAALCLGGINALTEPLIAQRKVLDLKQALQDLAPDGEPGEHKAVAGAGAVRGFFPVRKGLKEAGFILELDAVGYGGQMKVLARYGEDGVLQAAKLMDNQETPGLGKKAEDRAYMKKYLGRGSADKPVPVRKNMLTAEEAQAVTGATVTFSGIGRALAEGAAFIQQGGIRNAP